MQIRIRRAVWRTMVLLLGTGATAVVSLFIPFLSCPSCGGIASTLERGGFFVQFADIDRPEPYKTACPECRDRNRISPLRRLLAVGIDSNLRAMLQNPRLRQKDPGLKFLSSQTAFFSSLKALLARSSHPLAASVSAEVAGQRFGFGQLEFSPLGGRSHMLCRLLQGHKIRHDPTVAVLILFDTDGKVEDIVTLTVSSESGVAVADFLPPSKTEDVLAEFLVLNDPALSQCMLTTAPGTKTLFRGPGRFEGKVRVALKAATLSARSEQ